LQVITQKRIIAIELILLLLTSIVTGQILISNYQNGNAQNKNNQKFNVQILSDKADGIAPLEIELKVNTNLNYDEIIIYQWNFGDGESSSEKNPKHTFEKPGSFQIQLKIIDSNGNYYTDNITINVEEEQSLDVYRVATPQPTFQQFQVPTEKGWEFTTNDRNIPLSNFASPANLQLEIHVTAKNAKRCEKIYSLDMQQNDIVMSV